MRQLRYAFIFLLLAGCAGLGLAPAQTFDQKLAYAIGTYEAIQQATAQAINDKTLPSTDGTQILKMADSARVLLDGAKSANKLGDPTTANGRLALAVQVLTQLQTYIRSKQ